MLPMNSTFYTSSGAQPQSLADEILQRIRFGTHGLATLDEFTLHRYEAQLMKLAKDRTLDDKEHAALAAVLFGLGKRHDAIATTDEGLVRYPDSLQLLGTRAVAKIHLWQHGEASFDPDREWFDHPANSSGAPLRMMWGIASVTVADGEIVLDQEMQGIVTVHRDQPSLVEFGPFQLEFDYQDVVEHRFAMTGIVFPVLLEAYFLGRLSEDELTYLRNTLGDGGFHQVERLRRTEQLRGKSGTTYEVELFRLPGEYVAFIRSIDVVGVGGSESDALQSLHENLEALLDEKLDSDAADIVVAQHHAAADLAEVRG